MASDPIVSTMCDGRRGWLMRTANSTMIVSARDDGVLLLDHWGGDTDDVVPQTAPAGRPSQRAFADGVPVAYTAFGEPTFKEPCLCVTYADGSRVARPAIADAVIIDGRELRLTCADEPYGLTVEHQFVVRYEHDVIERRVRLANTSDQPIQVERVASAAVALPTDAYEAHTLHGAWGAEFSLEQRRLQPGKFVTESRRGFTSNEANPWFAITRAGAKDGPTWFGALAWSGNWSIVFETERNGALHVVAGIQPFDFTWRLEPGEEFTTPTFVCGYAERGLGAASRLMHRYQADHVLPASHRDTLRPVHYNSWFATYFDVAVDHQIKLAHRAAELGAELFVVDDGWFGARDNEQAGLGDWVASPRKFPHGLGELAEEVHRLGMQFGIWAEPEMVNPDSDLYRAHPDWTLRVAGRSPTLARGQLVLNLARDDVRANIHAQLRSLLRDHEIDYLKLDHNRPFTEAGWPEQPADRQRELWVRQVWGIYEIIDKLRAEFPNVLVETCAGGGGRVDLGILARADQAWPSDNTDPADRLRIQYGYSQAYPARTLVNWVTDNPNPATGRAAPLEFAMHVAMHGVLGISADILRWTDDERRLARKLIAEYKSIRHVIQHGDQFWLLPPAATGPCAVQYVSRDRGETVLLTYQPHGVVSRNGSRIRMCGLDPERRYERVSDGHRASGASLMGAGLPVPFPPAPAPQDTSDWRSAVDHWRSSDL